MGMREDDRVNLQHTCVVMNSVRVLMSTRTMWRCTGMQWSA